MQIFVQLKHNNIIFLLTEKLTNSKINSLHH